MFEIFCAEIRNDPMRGAYLGIGAVPSLATIVHPAELRSHWTSLKCLLYASVEIATNYFYLFCPERVSDTWESFPAEM